jgi:hypothetical protein
VGGACHVDVCAGGFKDCDGNPANGCEVNTNTDSNNCGGCGKSCAAANANTDCASGACEILSCVSGFNDCDKNPANGCEVNGPCP